MAGVMLTSCSKDDDNDGLSQEEKLAQEQNAKEERAVPISELSSGFSVPGAQTATGAIPASSGNLSFTLQEDRVPGFSNFGTLIYYRANAEIQGVAIRFKDASGTLQQGFYKLDKDADNYRIAAAKVKVIRNLQAGRIAEEDDFERLYLRFSDEVMPGKFSVEMAVYNANDQYSPIQTIAVEVQAWGGNARLVGNYLFDRYEPAEDDDYTEDVLCVSGTELNNIPYYKRNDDALYFNLKSDGVYDETHVDDRERLDYNETAKQCSPVYETVSYEATYRGYWAYDAVTDALYVFDAEYESVDDPEENEVYDPLDEYIYNRKFEIIDSELAFIYEYMNDSNELEVEKKIFKRIEQ